MPTITIPKNITKGSGLIVIPRKDYEKLLAKRVVSEYRATEREKTLLRARKNRAAGKFLTLDELKQKLGFTS